MRLVALTTAVITGALGLAVYTPTQALAAPAEEKKESKVVTVKAGDSLSKIAKANDTNYKRLFDANTKISHPDVIHPGDKIRVPAKDEKLTSRALPAAPTAAPVASTPVAAPAPAQTYYATPAPQRAATTSNAQPADSNVDGGVWDQLAQCESGGNWAINTGNGYYGGLQFTQSSWEAAGGSGSPQNASKAQQIAAAENLQSMQGWGAWPACSSKLGLR